MKLKLVISLLFFVSTQVHAEACSYDEAILALQHGNALRAHALLQMAARDGDKRAQRMVSALQLPLPLDSQNQALQSRLAENSVSISSPASD